MSEKFSIRQSLETERWAIHLLERVSVSPIRPPPIEATERHRASPWSSLQVLRPSLDSVRSEPFNKALVTDANLPVSDSWRNDLLVPTGPQLLSPPNSSTWNWSCYIQTWFWLLWLRNWICIFFSFIELINDQVKQTKKSHSWPLAPPTHWPKLELKDVEGVASPPQIVLQSPSQAWTDHSLVGTSRTHVHVPGASSDSGDSQTVRSTPAIRDSQPGAQLQAEETSRAGTPPLDGIRVVVGATLLSSGIPSSSTWTLD